MINYENIINEFNTFINIHLLPIIETHCKKYNEQLENNIFNNDCINNNIKKNIIFLANLPDSTNYESSTLPGFIQALKGSPEKTVLDIGFHSGFSSLLFLMSNPNIKVTSMDIVKYSYVIPCYLKIKEFYKNRINLIWGNSTEELININHKFDIFNIDGSYEINIIKNDIKNSLLLVKDISYIILNNDINDIDNLLDNHNNFIDFFNNDYINNLITFNDVINLFDNHFENNNKLNKKKIYLYKKKIINKINWNIVGDLNYLDASSKLDRSINLDAGNIEVYNSINKAHLQGIPGGLAPEAETLDTAEPIGSALAGACERLQQISDVTYRQVLHVSTKNKILTAQGSDLEINVSCTEIVTDTERKCTISSATNFIDENIDNNTDLPKGSWINSSKNYYIENNYLNAEIQNCDGTWNSVSVKIHKNIAYDNNNGILEPIKIIAKLEFNLGISLRIISSIFIIAKYYGYKPIIDYNSIQSLERKDKIVLYYLFYQYCKKSFNNNYIELKYNEYVESLASSRNPLKMENISEKINSENNKNYNIINEGRFAYFPDSSFSITDNIYSILPGDMSEEKFINEKIKFYKTIVYPNFLIDNISNFISIYNLSKYIGIDLRDIDKSEELLKIYLSKIYDIRKNNNKIIIFTNNNEIKEKLLEDKNIIVPNKCSDQTYQNLYEMLLLSKTNLIIGSPFSPFSYESAFLQGTNIELFENEKWMLYELKK